MFTVDKKKFQARGELCRKRCVICGEKYELRYFGQTYSAILEKKSAVQYANMTYTSGQLEVVKN